MSITPTQIALLTDAHARGLTDAAIARHAGMSLSTVKRHRSRLSLTTTFVPQLRGKEGERLLVDLARARGLSATWAPRHNDKYDLLIEGVRVDAKASMRRADGTWRFPLPRTRTSFGSEYTYRKAYATDCEYLALVALYPDEREPDVYFVDSATAPTNIVLRPGGVYDTFRNDWTLLTPGSALVA